MDQAGIAVKCEDNGLVAGEQHVIIHLTQAMGMLVLALQAHQVNHIDDPYTKLREGLAQYGYGSQSLKRRSVAAAGHYNIRLLLFVC